MTDKTLSILAQNINKRKSDLKITSNLALANKSGVSRSIVTNVMLHPEKSLMVESAVLLARALECRVEWLVSGIGIMNEECSKEEYMLLHGSPLVTLNELAKCSPDTLLQDVYDDENRRCYASPAGFGDTTYVLKSQVELGIIPAGSLLYFSHDLIPHAGDIVVAATGHGMTPEIMEFSSIQGKQFLKSLQQDIPQDLKFFAFTEDMDILGVCTAVGKLLR